MYQNPSYSHLGNAFYKLTTAHKMLHFNAQTHTYTFKQKLAYSASQVNRGSKDNFKLVAEQAPKMLHEAARKGTQLHAFIYKLLKANVADFSLCPDDEGTARHFHQWGIKSQTQFDIVALELPLVADLSMAKIALCGTLDAVLFDKINAKYVVLDGKRSSQQNRNYYVLNYGIQLSIYKQLFIDNTINVAWEMVMAGLVIINKKGVKLFAV